MTLPVAMRHKPGLGQIGGKLQARFDERKGELIITKPMKPMAITQLSEHVSRHVKPDTAPVTDLDGYYQAQRKTAG